eukprot:TRINITY_DN55591_c0_g1_i1.p1 TRINITY_DN55591_c0_g1~~TRINITY_DN55591_c0_g1_i1.p1  ORF type:complete len:290 (+),score=34.79 TRINITY_DN55591_c0_g1_i1:83-952(+)
MLPDARGCAAPAAPPRPPRPRKRRRPVFRPLRAVALAACAGAVQCGAGTGRDQWNVEYCAADHLGPTGGLPVSRRIEPALWSQPPTCSESSVQQPERVGTAPAAVQQSAIVAANHTLVDLTAIPNKFCCHSNYTAMIPVGSSVQELDEKARRYVMAAHRILLRFDCATFYPFLNCTPCENAYRSWVCAVLLPRACRDDPERGIVMQKQKICEDVCYEVVRKCPVQLSFKCPPESDTYGGWGTPPEGGNISDGSYVGECNSMHLNVESGARPAAAAISALAALATAAALH